MAQIALIKHTFLTPLTPLPKALTTRVRKHRVPAGARGSKAATRSHTLIFLVVKKWTNTMALLKRKRARAHRQTLTVSTA